MQIQTFEVRCVRRHFFFFHCRFFFNAFSRRGKLELCRRLDSPVVYLHVFPVNLFFIFSLFTVAISDEKEKTA